MYLLFHPSHYKHSGAIVTQVHCVHFINVSYRDLHQYVLCFFVLKSDLCTYCFTALSNW